jgi:hypothetical protein
MDDIDIPESYYLKHSEPIQGCLFALKRLILSADKRIREMRKYQVPFFYFKEKKLCFLWVNRKKLMLGFVTDKTIFPVVGGYKRKDETEMIQIDPESGLPVGMILKRIEALIILYESA